MPKTYSERKRGDRAARRSMNMPVARKNRRVRNGSGSVDKLKTMVDSLIKENQRLKRQLVRLEAQSVGRTVTAATRGLSTIARRLERALDPASVAGRGGRRTRGTASRGNLSTSPRPRKPASPETQAKRLAALAKAREARAAKMAVGS